MPNKSLSVSKDDLPIWDEGERKAKAARQSMSGYVLSLIERDNPGRDGLEPVVDNTATIVVLMHVGGRVWRESFVGKWVIGGVTKDDGVVDATYGQTGLFWQVGITAAGRPVAYRTVADSDRVRKQGNSIRNTESALLVFDTVQAFTEGVVAAGFPESSVKYAVEALEQAVIRHHAWW